MSATKAITGWLLPALAALALNWSPAILAQGKGVEPEARALLQRSTDYLAATQKFSFDLDTILEIVTDSGQKLQFWHGLEIKVQRPDRIRVDRVGDLVNQSFLYDGKSLAVTLPEEGYYAMADAPPIIDAMLDFALDTLRIVAPGADLLYANAFDRLIDGLSEIGRAHV